MLQIWHNRVLEKYFVNYLLWNWKHDVALLLFYSLYDAVRQKKIIEFENRERVREDAIQRAAAAQADTTNATAAQADTANANTAALAGASLASQTDGDADIDVPLPMSHVLPLQFFLISVPWTSQLSRSL